MKRVVLSVLTAFLFSGGFVASGSAAAPEKQIASLFNEICLKHLPGFTGVNFLLEDMGYYVVSNGSYHEFGDEGTGIWGAVDIDEDYSGCSINHDELSEIAAQQLGLQLLNRFSEHEPMIWKYEGVPSGWVVPYQDKMLYIIYNQGGLSSDVRDK